MTKDHANAIMFAYRYDNLTILESLFKQMIGDIAIMRNPCWYGDVEYYNGAEAMEIAGLTEEELQSSLPGLKPENIFVTKLDPEKIITDGEDKTATNMNDQTLWTRLWLIEENEDNVVAVVFDLETFSMESYTKVK